ncbi:MAG: hypothetical protein JWM41_1935 [Gemmatimonadetes bacterium]|nr:hypothetical protein [Gemmatimonadota bacterium]
MSEYRIEKLRRPVKVALVGGATLDGDIFLQPSARYRTGPQEPAELFNEEDEFVPLATTGDELVLLAKAQIRTVEFGAGLTDTPFAEVAGAAVDVVLADGSVVAGELRMEIRASRPRLLDFLNEDSQRFLTLRSSSSLCLVNRRLIAQVRHRR